MGVLRREAPKTAAIGYTMEDCEMEVEDLRGDCLSWTSGVVTFGVGRMGMVLCLW